MITTSDLDHMSADQINTARRAGQLNHLFGGPMTDRQWSEHLQADADKQADRQTEADASNVEVNTETETTITSEDLKTMTSNAINTARREGKLDHLLRGQ